MQSGSFWRIVPLEGAPRIPLPLTQDPTGASLPADDRMVMNVVALRFVTAGDMSKILSSYLSEAGHIVTHEPGNILLITDTSRSMKRLMELVNLFDATTLAQQRVRAVSGRKQPGQQPGRGPGENLPGVCTLGERRGGAVHCPWSESTPFW